MTGETTDARKRHAENELDARKRAEEREVVKLNPDLAARITELLAKEIERQGLDDSQGPWTEAVEHVHMVPPVKMNVDGYVNLTALARIVAAREAKAAAKAWDEGFKKGNDMGSLSGDTLASVLRFHNPYRALANEHDPEATT